METNINKFDNIIKYISLLNDDKGGIWIFDDKNDGTPEKPIQLPFVCYSEAVDDFVCDVMQFVDDNPDFDLRHYYDILQKNGIKWEFDSMKKADVSNLDEQCIMALLVGAVRAEHFCDGALLNFFKDGDIYKWLQRLKTIMDEK